MLFSSSRQRFRRERKQGEDWPLLVVTFINNTSTCWCRLCTLCTLLQRYSRQSTPPSYKYETLTCTCTCKKICTLQYQRGGTNHVHRHTRTYRTMGEVRGMAARSQKQQHQI
mmetsp:Transcript_8088/g.21895  ORF Transcript_8088/g.21895 Transcript_8088/m.21895 type:complete len:112 (-) Transcript_8088:1751-2086(-)